MARTVLLPVSIMDIVTWLIVGLVAGVLASLVVGSGGSILIDIVIGIVGAFIGGWVFTAAGWHTPFAGLPGTIFIAFIGSVILLLVLHLLRGRSRL
ncbi:MAG: GlsB/YeaQ/YmgE family stress response membrane protein [Kofleriaceae bacterium]